MDENKHEAINALIDLIKFKKKLTEEEICEQMGLNKNYISQMRTRNHFPEKFINNLKLRYKDVIESEPVKILKASDVETVIYQTSVRLQVVSHYIAEMFADQKGVSVAKVLHEMEQLERESAARLINTKPVS